MRLTDYTDYSLRALIYVASHPDEAVTIQHIADAYGIPRNHLIKIVQKLGQAGFLRTTRGRAGGLRLGRPAADINIGEVVRTTESDFAMVECFHDENHCVITRACVLKGVLQRALQAWFEVLDGVTLLDLVDKPAALNRAFTQALALADVRDTLREATAKAPKEAAPKEMAPKGMATKGVATKGMAAKETARRQAGRRQAGT